MLIVCIVLAIVVIREVLSEKYVKFTRNNLRPESGKSLESGCRVFYFDGLLPFTLNKKNSIEKFYGPGSIIVDNDDVYRVTKIRERTREEKEYNSVGVIILEVEQYPRNRINKVPMQEYNKWLYILYNQDIYIDLSGYEGDIKSTKNSLKDIAHRSLNELDKLSVGFPISIESALSLGSAISSRNDNQNLLTNDFFTFWKDVCSILQKETGFTNNNSYVNTVNMHGNTYINGDVYTIFKDPDDT